MSYQNNQLPGSQVKTMTRGGALALAMLSLGLTVGGARAQEQAGPAISANVSVVSQYVSRGVRQTWGHPALQAGVDYVHPSGWSAGTWVSGVSDKYIEKSSVEWDLYGGYGGSAGALGYSAMVYYYKYPGAIVSATGTRYDYGELSGGLTLGPAYAKLNYTFTRDFFGIADARGTTYLDLGANPALPGGFTLNLHVGSARVAGAGNDYWNWRDAKIGLTRAFDGGWTASLAWTRGWGPTEAYTRYTTGVPGASGQPEYGNTLKGTVVLGVTKTF